MAMLAMIALMGAVQASLGKGSRNLAYLTIFVLEILGSYCAFVWYCRDSDERRYRRSLWRNMLFNGVAVLFVPWYLLRTRPSGARLNALFRLGGMCLLMLAALMVGAVCGLIAAKLF